MTSLQRCPHLPPGCTGARALPNTPEQRNSEADIADRFAYPHVADLIAMADDPRVSDGEFRRMVQGWIEDLKG